MANLHMVREHGLGLAAARKVASGWAAMVGDKLGMTCTGETGRQGDTISFTRSGVKGTLQVTKDRFELEATLGLLVGAFKDRIEAEITRYLDELLATGHDPLDELVAKKGRAG